MATTESTNIEVSGYLDVLAAIKQLTPIHYTELGSYQGTYIAVLGHKGRIFFFSGGYGSCSGCDWFQDESEYDYETGKSTVSYKVASDYCDQYQPSFIVPQSSVTRELVQAALDHLETYESITKEVVSEIVEAVQREPLV